jgi:hypothetical protein
MIGVNLEGGDLAGLRSVQCSAPVVDMIEHQPMQLQGPYVVVGQDECMHVILPRLHPDVYVWLVQINPCCTPAPFII